MNESAQPVPPSGFWQHVRSLGPGLVVALTWLGAGDLVDSAVAGGSYGYGLMWAMVIALVVRFFFVSIIAKYQLCNQHGEGHQASSFGEGLVHRAVRPHAGWPWGSDLVPEKVTTGVEETNR